MNGSLLDKVWERSELAAMDRASRRLALRSIVAEKRNGTDAAAVAELANAVDGYGPLTELMVDDHVTDILVNGPFDVWADRAGRLEQTDVVFEDEAHLVAFIERTLADGGTSVHQARPIADTRMRDGSRIHVVLPPIAQGGPLVSIRRWPTTSFDLADLVAREMMTPDEASRLGDAVTNRVTMAISGATGTGKTTLLNALLGCVAPDERIVVVEETRELRPRCLHVVSLLARAPNVEGTGEVDLSSLVRAALRMRPDRIVVGEVRGAEAAAALTAMSTGHEGSFVTVHARSADEVLDRLTSCALHGGPMVSEETLRRRFSAVFGMVVHLERDGGVRRVAEICRR